MKRKRLDLASEFALKVENKVMFNQYDGCRVWHFDPKRQEEVAKDFTNIAWLVFSDRRVEEQNADHLASLFTEYGDFNLTKDSKTSCYIEFYYFEPSKVPTQTIQEFISVATSESERLGLSMIVPFSEAVKFRSHNRIDDV